MPPADAPRLLVVIPTLNERRAIEATVRCLHAAAVGLPDVRTVVCDGGSTDGTVEIVRALCRELPGLSLLHNPKVIQSAAMNLAVATYGADRDCIVRCDAHALYPDDFLRKLVATQARTGSDAVVVPMDTVGLDGFSAAVSWVSNSLIGTGGSAHRAGRRSGYVDHGHHALVRREAFEAIGGYDETFTHNEDAEFDCRLRKSGRRIYLDSDIRIIYHPRASFGALWRQYYNYGKGRARTVRRHPDSMRLRQMLVPTWMLGCALALASAPFFVPAVLPALVYAGALGLFAAGIAWRERTVLGLLTAPVALTIHTSWGLGFLICLLRRRRPA